MPHIIEVTVSPKGEVLIKTMGYTGADCLQASKFLEQALGVTAIECKTVEFYSTAKAEQRLSQQ